MTTSYAIRYNTIIHTNTMYTLDTQAHEELKGLIEDSVAQFCQDNMVSGELAWLVTQTLAEAKIAQFKGKCL